MKKVLFFTSGSCLSFLFSSGQMLSFTGLGGYTFQDKVSYSNAYGYVNAGGHWGASVEGISKTGQGIELLYQQQPTHTPMYYYNSPTKINENSDQTTISYFMLNGVDYLLKSRIQPYGGVGIGVALIDTKSYGSATKFSWDAKLGVRLKASSRISVKVQAQLYAILQAEGGDFYTGSGGSGVAVNSTSSIYQFGFSGGICLNFEKKGPPM